MSQPHPKMVKIDIKVDEEFKRIYTIGAMGGFTPYDFRIAFYNDVPAMENIKAEGPPSMNRIVSAEIILPPTAAKELLMWLGSHIKQFEDAFGEIKIKRGPPSDGGAITGEKNYFT